MSTNAITIKFFTLRSDSPFIQEKGFSKFVLFCEQEVQGVNCKVCSSPIPSFENVDWGEDPLSIVVAKKGATFIFYPVMVLESGERAVQVTEGTSEIVELAARKLNQYFDEIESRYVVSPQLERQNAHDESV